MNYDFKKTQQFKAEFETKLRDLANFACSYPCKDRVGNKYEEVICMVHSVIKDGEINKLLLVIEKGFPEYYYKETIVQRWIARIAAILKGKAITTDQNFPF